MKDNWAAMAYVSEDEAKTLRLNVAALARVEVLTGMVTAIDECKLEINHD